MISIAHTSDLHIDERGRVQDVVTVLDAFLRKAKDLEVDLIVLAGDFFERRSTPSERLVLADFLEAAGGIAPVFGVKGNHDAAFDLELFPRLNDTAYPVLIKDRPSALPGSATPLTARNGAQLGLLALPWFDKAHMVAGLPLWQGQDDDLRQTIETAQALLTAIGAEAARCRREGIIPILVGHLMVAGSEVATGQTLIGITVEIPPHDLHDVGAAYVALGHVHQHQAWFGGQVAYSGSPHRCNFGEPEQKGFCFVTLENDGTFFANEFVPLPARPMVLVEADWTEGGWNSHSCTPAEHAAIKQGALVRYRFRIKAEDLHRVDDRQIVADLMEEGASEVKTEAVIVAETRARAPEIVAQPTTLEKLQTYMNAKGIVADPVTWGRLTDKTAALIRKEIES